MSPALVNQVTPRGLGGSARLDVGLRSQRDRHDMRNLLCLAALLFIATPTTLLAQSAVSLQAGAMTGESDNVFEVGVRVSPARANTVGLGFSFDALPQFLGQGALIGVTDLSLAGTIILARDVRLELRAGGSALLGIGGGGAAALGGYHLGAGMVFGMNGPVGLRADYTWRHLEGFEESVALPSLTIGVVLHP